MLAVPQWPSFGQMWEHVGRLQELPGPTAPLSAAASTALLPLSEALPPSHLPDVSMLLPLLMVCTICACPLIVVGTCNIVMGFLIGFLVISFFWQEPGVTRVATLWILTTLLSSDASHCWLSLISLAHLSPNSVFLSFWVLLRALLWQQPCF